MLKHEVRRYMTPEPVVTKSSRTLWDAHQLMRERGVRHLPVVDDGRLVGIVSQRDLYLLETLRGVDIATETVDEAMTADPYTVDPTTSVAEVAHTMAEHRYGSAVVVDRGEVVGVFTTTDALRALAGLIQRGPHAAEPPQA